MLIKKVDLTERSHFELGLTESGLPEPNLEEVGTGENGLGQIGFEEFGFTQIGFVEIRFLKENQKSRIRFGEAMSFGLSGGGDTVLLSIKSFQ